MVVVVAAGEDGRLTEFHHHDADFFIVNSEGRLSVGKREWVNQVSPAENLSPWEHYGDWTSVRYRNGRGAIEAYRTPPLRIEKR